ncbi:MAG: DUF3987 domain-containing protein [Actinomycetota bacterium]|nr:DUF3987 domain-containing protein [Actinomycetota bacterium]
MGEHYEFFCPVHEDGTNRAGELSQGDKGALICCHAGCQGAAILDALALKMADLFDEAMAPRLDWDHPDARYVYRDADGNELYEVRRLGFGHDKAIRPFHANGNGSKMGLPAGPRVLYRLPELVAAVAEGVDIFITEGERDADAIYALGHAATTNVGGAMKWKADYNRWFVGADVVIVRDRDEAGCRHALQVVENLSGVAASVRVVEALEGNDVADHLRAGHSLEELVVCDLAGEAAPAEVGPAAPQPSVTSSVVYGWPVLDPLALHGVIGEAVREVAPYTEADPAAILATLVTLTGISIGGGPRVYAGLEPQPARLQLWIVGDSALGRKGSSWGAARTIMETADAELMANRVLSGFGSGEALVDAVADENAGDCRLVVLAKEGGRLLSVMSRLGDTTSAILRDAYDTDNLAVRSRAKTSVAKQAHIGIVVHITPADLVGQLSDTQIRNGVANRALFCASRRPHLIPRGRPVPPSVSRIARELGASIARGRSLVNMDFDEPAGQMWDGIYGDFGATAPTVQLADLEARGDMHCLRLAMIFALVDGSRLIGTAHLDAALALWSYCRDSARYLFGPDGANEAVRPLTEAGRAAQRFEDDLAALDAVLSEAGQLTGTEQRQVFANHRSAAHIGRLRKELIVRGQAAEQNEATSGRSRRLLVAVER